MRVDGVHRVARPDLVLSLEALGIGGPGAQLVLGRSGGRSRVMATHDSSLTNGLLIEGQQTDPLTRR